LSAATSGEPQVVRILVAEWFRLEGPAAEKRIEPITARRVMIYPGPLGIPEVVPPDAPPAFLLAADDDVCCSAPVVKLLEGYRAAKIPVEAHIFTQGGHGFNMGYRSHLATLKGWPQRLADWMADSGILKPRE
jgi:acetyl esterase/lipase